MAADPNPTLRDELNAALGHIAPQIRGLHGLGTWPISGDLRNEVNSQIAVHERRRDLIIGVVASLDAVVAALEKLERDGYPALDPIVVKPTLFGELQGDIADLTAAVDVFKTDHAANLIIGLGEAAPKP